MHRGGGHRPPYNSYTATRRTRAYFVAGAGFAAACTDAISSAQL